MWLLPLSLLIGFSVWRATLHSFHSLDRSSPWSAGDFADVLDAGGGISLGADYV
jgi:hypothetical protein